MPPMQLAVRFLWGAILLPPAKSSMCLSRYVVWNVIVVDHMIVVIT